MDKCMLELKEKFEFIRKKGYIKGIYNNLSSIGRTFERELNLPENEFCVPDYYGIEIKTRRAYSKSAITLFNVVPDSEDLFEVERLKETYGYPYKKDKRYKVLYIEAFGDRLNYAGVKFQYKIDVDKQEEKVYLCVYNRYDELLERKVYWSFDYLESKIILKLKYLSIVNAWTNTIENWNYFKYYKINFFKLRNFEKFVELLEKGYIKLVFKVGIYTSEKYYGNTYDHGCGFTIKDEDVCKLFYKLDI